MKESDQINRRRVLKYTAVAIAAGTIISNELIKETHGVPTGSGTFIPLYENHNIGIDPEEIPKDAKIFYKEVASYGGMFAHQAKDIVMDSFDTNQAALPVGKIEEIKMRLFPEQELETLAQNKIEIMLGDVRVTRELNQILLMLAESIGGAGLALETLALSKLIPEKTSQARLNRRKLLTTAGYAGGLWGFSNFPLLSLTVLTEQAEDNDAIKRIADRLYGLQSHLHPELPLVFFRNALKADKLLTVATEYKNRTGEKPKVAFNVGAGHSGIEDFLQAGSNVCRGIILAHPRNFLDLVVEVNGGVEDFSSARLLTLPANLKANEPYEIRTSKLKQMTERKVTDTQLVKGLKQKLQ